MINPPTKKRLLADFQKWVSKGSDDKFQFDRLVRRWANSGYSIQELTFLVSASKQDFDRALENMQNT